MPTVLSHAVAAVAIGAAFQRDRMPTRYWAGAIACAVIPDLDVVAFSFGIPYGAPLGHRGLSHSLVIAVLLGGVATATLFPTGVSTKRRLAIFFCFCLAAASHGLLDAFTNGGLGIALLAPFDNTRYFAPWRPIEVSPIGLRSFLSNGGAHVLSSEVVWIWLPSAVLMLCSRWWRPRTIAIVENG